MRRFYDRQCESCGWQKIDSLETTDQKVSCPDCGDPTIRVWRSKPVAVIGDEMDHVQVNGLKEPRRFRSKQERQRWMKENNLREYVKHEDGDGRTVTTRWATMDQYTLDNARELVERAAKEPARNRPRLPPVPIETFIGEVGGPEHQAFGGSKLHGR